MKKLFAIILALSLALSLTACNKSGDTPTGDNSTPGTSDTSTPEATSGGDTTTPGNNNGAGKAPTWADPSKYDKGIKADTDERISEIGKWSGIDVDNALIEAVEEYGQFFNENITPEALRAALTMNTTLLSERAGNISGISNYSLEKVNIFLASKGKNALDVKNPKESIAALGIAATIFYQPNFADRGSTLKDLAAAFSCGFSDTGEVNSLANSFVMSYYLPVD